MPLDVGYPLKVVPSLHSHHSRAYHLAGASLPLDVGYLLTAPPAPRSHCSSATQLQHHSVNQDKLEVIKREVARVHTDVLGISKLKWTGMGEFNSDDHYIYDCGQESLEKWCSHHGQQKSPKCSIWMQSQKGQKDLCSFPRQTIQHLTNPSL